MKTIIGVVLVACTFVACETNTPNDDVDVTKLVQGTCECSRPLFDLLRQANELPQEEQMALMQEAEALQVKSEACMKEKGLEGKMEALFEQLAGDPKGKAKIKAIQTIMNQQCPDLYKMTQQILEQENLQVK